MMFKRLFGKKKEYQETPETPNLRLASSTHIAREQIDEVARIIDESVEVIVVGDYCGIKPPVRTAALSKTIPILDKAIGLLPGDMDLVVSKAVILELIEQGDQARTLRQATLDKQPGHFEAKMWEQHPENWYCVLHYPKWNEAQKFLHPVMSRHLSLGHRVQLVRDGLQKTIAIVTQIKGPAFDPRTQLKVKWVLSETPLGPLVAWYLRIVEPSAEPNTQEAFLPIFKPMFIPDEGYSLIQQLAWNPYCFVVLARGDSVELNHKLIFDNRSVCQIRDIATRLGSMKTFLPKEKFNGAMQWHMSNFDMEKLQFE